MQEDGFFHCYAFVLGQEIIKNNVKVEELRSVINNNPSGNSIGEIQYGFYIDTAYQKYCSSSTKLFDGDAALRFKDQGHKGFNKNPILYGPRFMTNFFGLSFSYTYANAKEEKPRATRLNMDTGVDFKNQDILKEIKETEELDFEKGGCKNAAVLFIFCAEAERALLEKECCSPLKKVEELIRDTQDVSNFLLRKAIMPDLQQVLVGVVKGLKEAVLNETNSSTTRFQPNGLFNEIRAFINETNPDEPDSIYEFRSLHIVIPNEISSLPENVIELKFHFFDIHEKELSFHYIESYSCNDEYEKPSDGYYSNPSQVV
ncbi:MAG: hypothetical protein JNK95_05640 [Candidatus Competibacter sp.]|nr:hypothetical protein [Candidatus Competibacter sp.]HRD50887.1 hypothetical protein [Candidatus Contendobacter sp.]